MVESTNTRAVRQCFPFFHKYTAWQNWKIVNTYSTWGFESTVADDDVPEKTEQVQVRVCLKCGKEQARRVTL